MGPGLRFFTIREWETAHRGGALPADGAVFVECLGGVTKTGEREGRYVTDMSPYQRAPPPWYLLNHSGKPNVGMVWTRGTVVWRALRDIEAGAELRFAYLRGASRRVGLIRGPQQ